MSIVVRSREYWLAGTLRSQFKGDAGIRDWIGLQDWAPLAGMTKKRIDGTVYTMDSFVDACVRDSVMLAISAFESAAAVEAANIDARSCAWQFIKYYYSAYFAANALMRLSGHACINLTAADCALINSWALTFGVGGETENRKLSAGTFHLQIDSTKTPTFTLRQAAGKGVHIQFWIVFLAFLKSLKTSVAHTPAVKSERDAAIADIDLLSLELQHGGLTQGSWLSEMRNAVNYRFEHGAWFPYSTQDVDRDLLRTSFRVHALNAGRFSSGLLSAPDLIRAARSCGYLVGWLKNSMELIGGYSKGRKGTLISSGALAFAAQL